MNNLFLGLITAAVIVAAIIFVFVMLEIRRAVRILEKLVSTTEDSLKPTVAEVQETLKSVRNVANNVTAVSEDMKILSGALRDVGENVQRVSGDVKRLMNFVDEMTSSATVEASGLKAGVKAGFWYFLKNLRK